MAGSDGRKEYAASIFQKAEPKIKQIHLKGIKIELEYAVCTRASSRIVYLILNWLMC